MTWSRAGPTPSMVIGQPIGQALQLADVALHGLRQLGKRAAVRDILVKAVELLVHRLAAVQRQEIGGQLGDGFAVLQPVVPRTP